MTILFLLSACGHPQADDLYGLWTNNDVGTIRVIEFGEIGRGEADLQNEEDVYWMFMYPDGSKERDEVERGTFTLERGGGWNLVTHVTNSIEGDEAGTTYETRLKKWKKDESFVIASEDDGEERTYEAVDSMP